MQCGFCGHQFNALERLYDKPVIVANELVEQEQLAAEPEFFIPELEVESQDIEEVTGNTREPAFDMEIDLPDPEPEPEPQTSTASTNISVATSEKPADEYPFPEELVIEEKPKAGKVSKLLWSLGVLLLLLAGTAQAAWFNRDILLSRYPQYLPQARQVCQHFKCTLIRNRNISAIKLLNRDVRIHPRYEDALLVNATMINLSNYTQRYPQVLLSLFNTDGKVIAYRQVAPTDYLDSSMDINKGMATDKPVHFVLEVADNGIGAVSFEFDFL